MFKIKKQWIAPEWESTLRDAGLLDIESVSKREFDWFEAPNRRHGGWSGVTRIVLNPDAVPEDQKAVFLKIQQNHFYRAPSTFSSSACRLLGNSTPFKPSPQWLVVCQTYCNLPNGIRMATKAR